MTAAWKQKKFERLAQKDVVEELKNQVRLLQDKLTDHKHKDKYMEQRIGELYKQRDEAMILANRYNRLRTEEVMIATPDGFKLVTGEELDIHCGQIEAKTQAWWGHSVDSYNYSRQMQAAMVYGTSIVKMEIEHGFNTRSESEETDQEDS
jgi:hypothetical protein